MKRLIRHGGIDSSVVLYLPMVGADGSTVVTDLSQSRKAVTSVGTAQLDTAQYKFAPSSLLLDGNSDYLTLADSADWDFGTGAFTIDGFVRFAALSGYAMIVGTEYVSGFLVRHAVTEKVLGVYLAGRNYEPAWDPAINTWYHFAAARSGTSLKVFINGTQIGSTYTSSDNVTGSTSGVYVGKQYGSTNYLNGWISDLRIIKGIALWTANFTPPTRRLI